VSPPTGAFVDLSGNASWTVYLDGVRVPGSVGWVSLEHGWVERLILEGADVRRARLRGRVELHHVTTGEVMR
jgi:hypothetical protein